MVCVVHSAGIVEGGGSTCASLQSWELGSEKSRRRSKKETTRMKFQRCAYGHVRQDPVHVTYIGQLLGGSSGSSSINP